MDFVHVIVLALVQAATEFLPVSSSGHLILVPDLLGWPQDGIAFDVALHLGTLIAVLAYFRRDVATLFMAWLRSIGSGERSADVSLAWGLALATIPAALAGLAFGALIEHSLRSPLVVAFQLTVFGLVLWLVDRLAPSRRTVDTLGAVDYLLLGMAQAIALIPGTSRSGITMTMARLLGLPREAAARLSFLMAIPVIALASVWEFVHWIGNPDAATGADDLLLGIVAAALGGYACIHGFMRLIGRIGFGVFAAYRALLAGVVLITLY